MDNATRSINEARRRVEMVRSRLQHPTAEALDRCLSDIESAVAFMRQGESRLLSRPEMEGAAQGVRRSELERLRRDLVVVNALMMAAARFHSGWARLISPFDEDAANYTPAGKVTATSQEKRLVLHG